MNKLILTFLSQLEYRFDILFKNDQVHKDLIRKSLKFYKVNTFIHIIEACIGRISKKTCKTCAKRQLEKSLS